MEISICEDMDLIKSILMDKAIYPHIIDDGCDEINPVFNDSMIWLVITENSQVCGAFMVHQHNRATWEIHTCLLPVIWGKKAQIAAKLMSGWFFSQPLNLKLITNVPEMNKMAHMFSLRSGMMLEGVNRKSFLKDGILYDQYVLGMTKEDWQCQQQFH